MVGCGNGRYIASNKDKPFLGCDRGIKFSEMCVKQGLNVLAADILFLPYRDQIFDNVICIAVLHHLATEKHRERAASELIRILKKGGKKTLFFILFSLFFVIIIYFSFYFVFFIFCIFYFY